MSERDEAIRAQSRESFYSRPQFRQKPHANWFPYAEGGGESRCGEREISREEMVKLKTDRLYDLIDRATGKALD